MTGAMLPQDAGAPHGARSAPRRKRAQREVGWLALEPAPPAARACACSVEAARRPSAEEKPVETQLKLQPRAEPATPRRRPAAAAPHPSTAPGARPVPRQRPHGRPPPRRLCRAPRESARPPREEPVNVPGFVLCVVAMIRASARHRDRARSPANLPAFEPVEGPGSRQAPRSHHRQAPRRGRDRERRRPAFEEGRAASTSP